MIAKRVPYSFVRREHPEAAVVLAPRDRTRRAQLAIEPPAFLLVLQCVVVEVDDWSGLGHGSLLNVAVTSWRAGGACEQCGTVGRNQVGTALADGDGGEERCRPRHPRGNGKVDDPQSVDATH